MKLRWYIKRYKVTAQTIRDYQEMFGGSMNDAKNELLKDSKVLQLTMMNIYIKDHC